MIIKRFITTVFAITVAFTTFTPYIQATDADGLIQVQSDTQRKHLKFSSAKKSYVQMNTALLEMPNTMEAWVKFDAGSKERQVVFGNYVTSNQNFFSIELTADQKLRYVENVFEGTKKIGAVNFSTEKVVATEEWMHIGVIRDVEQQRVSLLINGIVAKEVKLSGSGFEKVLSTVPLSNPHFIGTDARKKFFLNAEVSEIRLWTDKKTIDEINVNMNAALTGNEVGLQHAWRLDDTVTSNDPTLYDVKQDGINGKISGIELPDTPTYEKTGIDFSTNDKDIEMLHTLETVPMTFETWIKLDTSKKGTRSVITGNYHDAVYTGIPLINYEITAKGEPRMYWIHEGKATNYVATGVNIYNSEWTHIAITCNDTDIDGTKEFTTYINGQAVHSEKKEYEPVTLTQPLKIGEDARYAHYLKGSLSDLRLWSTSRTAQEIKENFNRTIETDAEGLLGNWLLDKAEEDGTYLDRSVHQNHAASYWISEDMFYTEEEGYHSIAVIPDTQWLTAIKPKNFTKLTTWLKDNKERLGIKFAIHVGDIVDSNSNNTQWINAQKSMNVLDGHIPYVFSGGNHDIEVNRIDGVAYGTRNAAQMNKYFPYEKFSSQQSFGGAYEEGKMDNTYSYFTVGGVDFMTISLEPFPRDDVLDWANKIVAEHSDRRVIVTTHVYMYYDGKPTTESAQHNLVYTDGANTGQQIWDEFASKHKNIISVVSGHVGYPDILMKEAIGEHGNVVQQVLCDAQFMDREDGESGSKQGLGMIMLMSFQEGSDEVHVNWYSTVRNKFFRQSNQFTSLWNLTSEVGTDKTALRQAVKDATQVQQSDTYHTAIPKARAAFDAALQQAVQLVKDGNTTKSEIEQMLRLLTETNEALQQKMGNKDALKTAYDSLDRFPWDDYAENQEKTALRQAYQNAKTVLDDENAVQLTIEEALENLSSSKEALFMMQEKLALGTLLHEIKAYEGTAFAKGWDAFSEARTEANKAYEQGVGCKEAKEMLSKAIAELRAKADITELKELLDKIQNLDSSIYEEQEYLALLETKTQAEQLLDDPTLSTDEQDIVDTMCERLQTMIDELTLIPDDKPEQNEKPDEGKVSDKDKQPEPDPVFPEDQKQDSDQATLKPTPDTGDTTTLFVVFAASLMSSSVLWLLIRQKLQSH